MDKYIITHKNFDESKFEDDYTILTNKHDLKFSHNVQYFEGLDDRLWSELAAYKWLADTLKDEGWISLNHYRRKLDRDLTDRICVATPMVLPVPVWQHYGQCHNPDDLRTVCDIVKEKTPAMIPALERTLNGNILVPYTIGVFNHSIFRDYINFLYTILDEFLKRIGVSTYEEMLKHVDDDKYRGKLDNRPEYQARIVSFVSERLATAYWNRCTELGMPIFPCNVALLEENQTI